MKPRERFRVQTAAEFINSGPPLGSREEKLAIAAEERAKCERERQRREHLAAMTAEDIQRERRIFERCQYFSQLNIRLADKQDELDKERLQKWLQ